MMAPKTVIFYILALAGLVVSTLLFTGQVESLGAQSSVINPIHASRVEQKDVRVAPGDIHSKGPSLPNLTWGPSYYADDINIEAERNQAVLEFMKQIDLKALRGVAEGPSYQP